MADYKWMFGLSLDEKIEWCFRKASKEGNGWRLSKKKDDFICGEIGNEVLEKYKNNFEEMLYDELRKIISRKDIHEIAEDVYAVGVSAIGLVDRNTRQLFRVARKDWRSPGKIPVVEFNPLVKAIFPKTNLINIHNESTAKCLAEWQIVKDRGEDISSIIYVFFSEGVNCGVVSNSLPPNTEMHLELGHIWPRLHPDDENFDPHHSGCRIHRFCFEGVASAPRIKNSWANGRHGVHLSELPPDPAWDIIAFYIAQMCMNGVLAFSPERVLLGGSVIFPKLLPRIRAYFEGFNDGGSGEPYFEYDAMHVRHFIRMAEIPFEEAGIAAALELACLADQPAGVRVTHPKPFIRTV